MIGVHQMICAPSKNKMVRTKWSGSLQSNNFSYKVFTFKKLHNEKMNE